MTQETIVAAFDSAADAQAAARDVEAAGVPASRITQHAGEAGAVTDETALAGAPRKQPGFWARLFGTEDDDYAADAATTSDHVVYDRTMAGGGAVLSIQVDEQEADQVLDILDRYNPVDIEERAASYAGGSSGESSAYAASGAYAAAGGAVGDETAAAPYAGDVTAADTGAAPAPATTPATAATATAGDTQRIQLAEEALVVGKRVVNQGTTRIRRYVVERPVSEDVALHRETVSVERRPVSGDATVAPDAFTDKTIEVTEMNEEAVVGKTARVVEEVVVRKDADDRVETVRDTVRREELEVEKTGDVADATSVPASKTPL